MNIIVPNEIEVIKLKHYENYKSKNLKEPKGYEVNIIQFSVDNIIFICAYNLENNSLELIYYMEHEREVGFGFLIDKYDDELYNEFTEFIINHQESLIGKFKYIN